MANSRREGVERRKVVYDIFNVDKRGPLETWHIRGRTQEVSIVIELLL